MKNIGIFGGTFDPFHNGHFKALCDFIEYAKLDMAFVIPTGTPPHKLISKKTKDCERLDMLRLATEGMKNISISDYEIKKGGKSYTAETLSYFKEQFSDDNLFLFTGSDMFITLHEWYCPEKIFSLAHIVVFSRNGNDFEILEKQNNFLKSNYTLKSTIYKTMPMVISSSKIRENIKQGYDCSAYLNPKVYNYIKEKGLYS